MCGVAGILTDPDEGPVPFEDLRRMVAMLRHRGPDEYGLFRDDHAGLGHARLSILDLQGGAQPIHNEDETVWVSFNGEIFNHAALREELEGRGHVFYTRTDTEVLVHGYEAFGDKLWAKLNGQFAIALWDRRQRHLWLVRDRVGIAPLYWARAGGRLLFASEIKALLATGEVDRSFCPAGMMEVFTRWSVPAPASVFSEVSSVPPATAIRFDDRHAAHTFRYWEADFTESEELTQLSDDDAADALEAHLQRAIGFRLRADVPVGAYLSGGLDSSVIGHYAYQAQQSPLETFAVRFADPAFDETVEQRRMADLLGTRHHEMLCGDSELRNALPDVVWHAESPLLRTAPIPLFLLSGRVRRSGMKVVLTGEGADELLAGYNIFKEDKIRRFWARQEDSLARPMLLSRLYQYVGAGTHQQTKLWQQFFARGLNPTDRPFYSHGPRWQNASWTLRFLQSGRLDSINRAQLDEDLANRLPSGWTRWRPLARAQMIEIATFMSSYLLASQGDRVAMGHGVEVRYPFLDPEVVDFCTRLPARMRLRGLRDKVLLRHLGRRSLPVEIWNRPKLPYRAPMTRAFFAGGDMPAYVEEMLAPEALVRIGWLDPVATQRLVSKARKRGGDMAAAREEMALVGVLTLQILGHQFGAAFIDRAAEARSRMASWPLRVCADLVGRYDGCGMIDSGRSRRS